jgi:hypothetical protein
MLFDHEPGPTGGATNVRIHDNVGNSGGLGYMNLQPLPKTPLTNITVTNNHLFSGHFRVMASANGTMRSGFFTFTNNITDTTTDYVGGYLGRVPLITVGGTNGGWDTVTIQHTHDHGVAKAIAISVSALSSQVVTTPNDFVGFRTP